MYRREFLKLFGGVSAAITAGVSLFPKTDDGWVKVKNYVIPAKRKLKVRWAPEAEQELQYFYNINKDSLP